MSGVTFEVEDGSRAFHGKLFAFSTLVDFLDENGTKESSAGTQSSITTHVENLSEQFMSYRICLTEGSDCWNEWICTPFGIDAVCEAKITDVFHDNFNLCDDRPKGSRQFSRKCPDLNDATLSFRSSLGQSAETALQPFWINKIVRGGGFFFFCCGVNQDQTEKIPAAGGRRDSRRQVYAT